MSTAAAIAAALGGAHRLGAWWRCRCPVHHSRGATLAMRDGERGLIIKCFAGCDYNDVLGELRRRRLVGGRGTEFRVRAADNLGNYPAAETARSRAWSRKIWERGRDAWRSPEIVRYLTGRGITISPPPCLRWLGSCRHPSGALLSAMIARVDDLKGEFTGVHRTYLTADFRRYDRASLGPIAGGAVRLAPAAPALLLGEGVETCLAAMQATAQPAWAALSTSGLVALVLPALVRTVIILADHDHNGAGQRAARTAAQRWLAEGRRVRIAMPPAPGTDIADVLAGHAYPRIADAGA